jgi:hypothetical protein
MAEDLHDESQAADSDRYPQSPVNPGPPHVNDPVRTRERLGSEWALVPLAIAGGMLVGFGLKWLRQPAARLLLPGRIAYDVAELVTPRLSDEPATGDASVNPRQLKLGDENGT